MPRNIGESRHSCFCDTPEKQDGRLGITFHFRGLGVGNELEVGVRARTGEERDLGRRRKDWEVSPGLVSGERRTNTSFVVRKALDTKSEFEFHFRSVQGIVKRQCSDSELN